MTPSGLVGRILKRLLLRPRVKKMNWEQLLAGGLTSASRFDERIAGVNEEAASVTAAGHLCLRDIAAHLTIANEAIAGRLEALRAGAAQSSTPGDFFPGAGARTLAQVRQDHAASLRRIAEAAAQPITSDTVADHDFFGPMNAREWLALVAFHHEYHARQAERIMRSEDYRKAQGAQW